MSAEEKNVEERPMTALEVIARIKAARVEKEGPQQAPRSCGGGGCSNCSCGKNNDAESV